jgi:hypothetical protein
MPYIWIPRIPHRKRKEMERVVEHVVESATKFEGLRERKSEPVSVGYLDERRLSEVASKARVDEHGRVAVVKGEGGQVYLKAGHEEVEIKRGKWTVADLTTGKKREI